jgi:endonuclease YncB( thermonuclease family)
MKELFIALLLWALPVHAADQQGTATILDGDTVVIATTTFRLDGIDAPELDQQCLDEKGEYWACGVLARHRLIAIIDGREMRCVDKGEDTVHKNRRIGQCVVGDTELNEWLVREGWAINFEPYAKGRFKNAEEDARTAKRGMWNGCFVAPQDFRRWNRNGAVLLGTVCNVNVVQVARSKLFPDDVTMPLGCAVPVKAKVTRRGYPFRGIYHVSGCSSYQKTTPNRWFCSEQDAKDAGFRKAFNCWGKG